MQTIETWNIDHFERGAIFHPLRLAARDLPTVGWPNVELVNALAQNSPTRVVNARGERIEFIVQDGAVSGEQYEAGTYLRGHVTLRAHNWHDLFNALVWVTFPLAKAALNARHFAELKAHGNARTPARDALTHFDEDGVAVMTDDSELLELIRKHEWQTLFVARRDQICRSMRVYIFGHALYDKARAPFIGLTGKALLFKVSKLESSVNETGDLCRVDRLLAAHVLNPAKFLAPRELSPIPILGVPGWWPANEEAAFYEDANYFRPARSVVTEPER